MRREAIRASGTGMLSGSPRPARNWASWTPEKIVTVDLEGKVLEGSGPSKEMDMHLAMYRARSNAQAVVHVHPTYAIAYSTLISGESSNGATLYGPVRGGRVPMISIIPLAPIRAA